MPQLDHVTYLSQYFWLCVFYFALYYGATKYWLPRLSRLLALREAKMSVDTHATGGTGEARRLHMHVAGIVAQAQQEARDATAHAVAQADLWTTDTARDLLHRDYRGVSETYVHTMAQELLSQEVALHHARAQAPVALRVAAMMAALRA